MTRSHLAADAAIAAVAIIVGCTVGEDPHEREGVLDLGSALLVTSRDRLEVCLHVAPTLAAHAEDYATRLRADLALLQAQHPDWHAAGLGHDSFAVVVGCPESSVPLALIDDKGAGGAVMGPGVQAAPSRFRAYIHVLDDASTVLGERPFGRAIAELVVVDEHRVAEVSTALVVRATALGTAAFRADALAQSIGLSAIDPL